MFDAILDWFNGVLNFCVKWVEAIYNYGHTAWVWAAAMVFALVTIFTDTFTWLNQMVTEIVSKISDLLTGVSNGQTTIQAINGGDWPMQSLALANYFSPINELLTCSAILFTLWVASSLIRVIKSWIPSIMGNTIGK